MLINPGNAPIIQQSTDITWLRDRFPYVPGCSPSLTYLISFFPWYPDCGSGTYIDPGNVLNIFGVEFLFVDGFAALFLFCFFRELKVVFLASNSTNGISYSCTNSFLLPPSWSQIQFIMQCPLDPSSLVLRSWCIIAPIFPKISKSGTELSWLIQFDSHSVMTLMQLHNTHSEFRLLVSIKDRGKIWNFYLTVSLIMYPASKVKESTLYSSHRGIRIDSTLEHTS